MVKQAPKPKPKVRSRPKGVKPGTEPVSVAILIDRSGSMESIKSDVIGGLNSYLKSLRADTAKLGKVLVTVTQFDSNSIDILHSSVEPDKIPDWTDSSFIPRASTPLYDAIGKTIAQCHGKTLFVIMTDGFENASVEYRKDSIKALIDAKTKDGWTFVYLGADQDAMLAAAGLGIAHANTMSFAGQNTRQTMDSLAAGTTSYRQSAGAQTESFVADSAKVMGTTETELRVKLTTVKKGRK